MKRLNLAIIGYMTSLSLFAQSKICPNRLEGIWQYVQTEKGQTDKTQHLPIWKVMEADYTFKTFIMADADGKSVITNTGTYNIVSDSVFIEHIAGSITDPGLIGKDNRITYCFEGENTLHISYRLPGAPADGKESWVRVKLEYPE